MGNMKIGFSTFSERSKVTVHDLEYLFHPSSIAIVGVSDNWGNWGRVWPQTLQEMDFAGNLYLVNPRLSEFMGMKVYPSLNDIPDSIDMVIVSVPAQSTPQVIEDCVARGVKVAHIYTAGFSENGAEGARLEKEIAQVAAKGGVRILGPNCMGAYYPAEGLSWRPDFPRESGSLAFLSQSGMNAVDFIKLAAIRGIRFSKAISYGNACDLNEVDILEYLAGDLETKVVAAYIEGLKDGQRFFRVLREVTTSKPVIILKGGRTEAGGRAAASHTGALASVDTTWDSLFKQTGAIRVYSIEELIDTSVAFLYMPPPENRNTTIIGVGGGPGVMGADDCVSAGLIVPPLPMEIRKELSRFTPNRGTSLANPLDVYHWSPKDWAEAIDIIGNWQAFGLLIIQLAMTHQHLVPDGIKALKESNEAILSAVKQLNKPTAVVLYATSELQEVAKVEQERFVRAGLPVYPSIASAARAINKLIQYQDYRSSLQA